MYCYPSFLSISICMKCFSIPSLSVCVFTSEVSLLWATYSSILWFFFFLIHSATLCLLIKAFNYFKFKVIIYRYVLTAIFCSFFSGGFGGFPDCFFLSYFPSLSFDDFLHVVFIFVFLYLYVLCIYYGFWICAYHEVHVPTTHVYSSLF